MDPTVILASVLLGLLVAWIASEAIGTLGGIEGRDDLSPQELSRRELCRRNRWYELFEPLIRRISVFIERSIPEKVTALERQFGFSHPLQLTTSEQISLKLTQAIVWATVSSLLVVCFLRVGPVQMLFLFLFVGTVGSFIGIRRLQKTALNYRKKVRGRLPFTLELMALMMESGGADISQALATAAEENRGHPIGQQLERMLADVSRGMTLNEALRAWANRYHDDDLSEVVFVIRTTNERGGPLKENLRALAEQFHQRRLHRLDRAAEEVKVHITWPGMLVMLACLVVVTAPFVITARSVLGLNV